MGSKKFWAVALIVTATVEEALRNELIPAAWVPYVSAVSTLLGFVVQRHKTLAA